MERNAGLYTKWVLMGVQGAWGLLLCIVALVALYYQPSTAGSAGQHGPAGLSSAAGMQSIQAAMRSLMASGPSSQPMTLPSIDAGTLLAENDTVVPPSGRLLSGSWPSVPLDNPSQTFSCLAHTPAAAGLALSYMSSSFLFNACMLQITGDVGANYRTIVFTARGLLTWAIEIAIFYAGKSTPVPSGGGDASVASVYGERLTWFAVMTLIGFALLIGGGVARLRFQAAFKVAEEQRRAADALRHSIQANAGMVVLVGGSEYGRLEGQRHSMGSAFDGRSRGSSRSSRNSLIFGAAGSSDALSPHAVAARSSAGNLVPVSPPASAFVHPTGVAFPVGPSLRR